MRAATFLRPIAHRGFHTMVTDATGREARIENSAGAFRAAIDRGYGIECDIQPSRDRIAIVHHDDVLARLTGQPERLDALDAADLTQVRYTGSNDRVLALADLLELVAGRVPLLVEIKTGWRPLPPAYLDHVAAVATAYRGPLALMSFDPAPIAAMKERAPHLPRGIVAGHYRPEHGHGWWSDVLTPERQYRLTHLLETAPAAPDFIAYHVAALPTPVTRYVREVQGLPLFTWTVRTEADRRTANTWADAAIFEGYEA